MTSASTKAWRADSLPCMPIIPSERGCSSGIAPLAMMVVATGAMSISARRSTSGQELDHRAPPPTSSRGRSALFSILIASESAERSSSGGGMWNVCRNASSGTCLFMTSLGRSMWTGPMRPVVAMLTPRLTASGISAGFRHRKLCLVIGIMRENESASWNALLPMEPVATCPVRTSMGDEST